VTVSISGVPTATITLRVPQAATGRGTDPLPPAARRSPPRVAPPTMSTSTR
jgi:hypothetical protein